MLLMYFRPPVNLLLCIELSIVRYRGKRMARAVTIAIYKKFRWHFSSGKARLRHEFDAEMCMLSRILRWPNKSLECIFLRENRGVNDAPQIRIIILLPKNRRSVPSTYKQFLCLVSSHAEMSRIWCSLTYNFPEIY